MMNKRIEELAKNAEEILHIKTGQTWQIHPAMATEFAQLIVKECAGLLEKEAISNYDEGTESFNMLMRESKWMKQYFGVEE